MKRSRKRNSRRRYRLVCIVYLEPPSCAYRIVDDLGNKVHPISRFLDCITVRGLSDKTVRSYAFDLLHFWRWFSRSGMKLRDLKESSLLDYIRFHYEGGRHPSPASINHRLTVVRLFHRYATGRALESDRLLPSGGRHFFERGPSASTGYLGRTHQGPPSLHVKMERRIVVPLTPEEVAEFLDSFRTWRDLAIVGVMLSCGLRTREVLELRCEDVCLAQARILVRGKGKKQRIVPLPPEVVSVLMSYQEIERPAGASEYFFVCLKGPARGRGMTAAAIRSLFRHHRSKSRVFKANPHRFRHTFGSDMARAGISLPALMHLLGHASIRTTMLYVTLSPNDVWEEFRRAAAKIRSRRYKRGHRR